MMFLRMMLLYQEVFVLRRPHSESSSRLEILDLILQLMKFTENRFHQTRMRSHTGDRAQRDDCAMQIEKGRTNT